MTSLRRKKADSLASLLDQRFSIPGTKIKVGLDSVLGLVPILGDSITSLMAGYIILLAGKDGVARTTLLRMMFNVAIDHLLGLLPIVGDFSDIFWKANSKNMDLWRKATTTEFQRKQVAMDIVFFLSLVTLILLPAVLFILGLVFVFK